MSSRKPTPPPPLSAASLGPRSSSLTPPVPGSASSSSSLSSWSKKERKRPSPLNLENHRDSAGIRQDEELSAQLMTDGLRSAISVVSHDSEGAESNLSHEIDNLSLLRQDVNANLRERPIPSGTDSPSSLVSSVVHAAEEDWLVPVQSLLSLPRSAAQIGQPDGRILIVDIRPLDAYRSSHLPDSVHLSLPPLDRTRGYTWETLGENVSPEGDGRRIWNSAEPIPGGPALKVILVASGSKTEQDQARRTLGLLVGLDNVKMVAGGWEAVLADKAVSATLTPATSTQAKVDAAPGPASFPIAQPHTAPTHKQSMPSLRTGIKRTNVPSLSIKTGVPSLAGPSRAPPPPKLALNLGGNVDAVSGDEVQGQAAGAGRLRLRQPSRSNTTGQYPDLHLNIPGPGPSASGSGSGSGSGSASPSLKSPRTRHGQDLKSPAVFSGSPTAVVPHTITGNNGGRGMAAAPFIVSTIIPSFLYLGPEITSHSEITTLRSMDIKRILNVAIECEDEQALGLDRAFERYTKIPMRDIVEETGVGRHMREACDLIDDARLHSEPVYVHCKAGKSRSVTVVLAYLIHAHAWTLQTAYAYVAERRKGISPNIGFVAELMQWEDRELGTKKQPQAQTQTQSQTQQDKKKRQQQQGGPRDSLPVPSRPQWISAPSSSLDVRPPRPLPPHQPDPHPQPAGKGEKGREDEEEDGRRRPTTRDEREVMKNGQWVQHRRAPTDRTTLQPGRRASKAGLESLRSPSPEIDA